MQTNKTILKILVSIELDDKHGPSFPGVEFRYNAPLCRVQIVLIVLFVGFNIPSISLNSLGYTATGLVDV